MLLLILAGCGQEEIEVEYGRRSGPSAGTSVNGTAVLGEMFSQAGHEVRSWSRLSPVLNEADVIVWFPDRFQGPKPETIGWLNGWLQDDPNHTLVYVGRDYDAEPAYWSAVLPSAPADQQPELQRRLSQAKSRVAGARPPVPSDEKNDWFTIDGQQALRRVRRLEGPWSQGIDAAQTEIELNSEIVPDFQAEPLLAADGDVLASRVLVGEAGTLIVVANGSFLLNYPLINREHRKLAGKLVDEIGPPKQKVFFLESGKDDPPIVKKEPEPKTPTGLEAFFVWPLNYVLLHLAVLGVLFMLARWPIFGIPKTLPAARASDFGQHVHALGALLEKTRDRVYAAARLRQYQQLLGIETAPPADAAGTSEGESKISDLRSQI